MIVARSPIASARLKAVAAAKKLHRALDLKQRVKETDGNIDVFEAIVELEISLVFKPLKTALGLCLPKPLRGIMITTRRGLHIQRFTAAHELGHVILDHEGSIDQEILERGSFSSGSGRDLKEVEADAFAAEFLLPRWLYRHHIISQGWSVAHLRNPEIVYQLSLRMGASYGATCWGLLGHQILPRSDVDIILKTKVAALKGKLGEEFRPTNSWADVWNISEPDNGETLSGNPEDLLRIELEEEANGGFQWNVEILRQAGFEILSDTSSFSKDPLLYGAPAQRTLIARPPSDPTKAVEIRETQVWRELDDDDRRFIVKLSFHGAEAGGMSRADKQRRGAAL